jgi:hypothetical protein
VSRKKYWPEFLIFDDAKVLLLNGVKEKRTGADRKYKKISHSK